MPWRLVGVAKWFSPESTSVMLRLPLALSKPLESPVSSVTLPVEVPLMLPTSSFESQNVAFCYLNARYPVVEMVLEGAKARVFRMTAGLRNQGR